MTWLGSLILSYQAYIHARDKRRARRTAALAKGLKFGSKQL